MLGDLQLYNLDAEIVKMMADGRKDREIATKLKIGIRTVERRRAELMRRIESRPTSPSVHMHSARVG